MKEIVAGIDIGGTGTKFGLTDKEGNILVSGSIQTSARDTFDGYLEELREALDQVMQSPGVQGCRLVGIGVGAPNGNYFKGTIDDAPNLRWRGIHHFTEQFGKFYDVPVVLTNDANAAAMGEMLFGAARGMKDFVVITLGTGLGSGFVVNGNILYGHDGFAGELGHIIVDINGRECGCGRLGCLETYVSASGIKRTTHEMLGFSKAESALRKIAYDDLSSATIAELAANGDTVALKVFDYTARMLGWKLADMVAHTSPEAIFLFGGLANAGEVLFEPVRRYAEQFMLNLYKNKVKILPSAIGEQNAAILGAAALIWHDMGQKRKQEPQNLSLC